MDVRAVDEGGVLPAAAHGGPVSHGIFRLARLHKALAGRLLRRLGLHPNQELLLMLLWDSGPQRQVDLAALLDADSATTTRSVQRLERAGFVRRAKSPTDGRVTLVDVTPAGRALRGEVERIWGRLEELTVGTLDADEQAAVLAALARLETNLAASIERSGRRAGGEEATALEV